MRDRRRLAGSTDRGLCLVVASAALVPPALCIAQVLNPLHLPSSHGSGQSSSSGSRGPGRRARHQRLWRHGRPELPRAIADRLHPVCAVHPQTRLRAVQDELPACLRPKASHWRPIVHGMNWHEHHTAAKQQCLPYRRRRAAQPRPPLTPAAAAALRIAPSVQATTAMSPPCLRTLRRLQWPSTST